jgi:hypothetical protein
MPWLQVFVDGGIRRGSDIFKALALGARAVGIGKPVVYAMCAYGADGISAMVAGLRNEFMNTMRLMGVTSVDQLRPRMVDTKSLCEHSAPAPSDHYTLQNYTPLDTAMARHEKTRAQQTIAVQARQLAQLEDELAAEKAKVAALEATLAGR